MIDNPGGGKKKKDDGNYYAEHIYASSSEPSSPLAGSREFTTAYYPFALTPRYDYFVIPVLSLSLFPPAKIYDDHSPQPRSRLRDSEHKQLERGLRPIVEIPSPPPIENEH